MCEPLSDCEWYPVHFDLSTGTRLYLNCIGLASQVGMLFLNTEIRKYKKNWPSTISTHFNLLLDFCNVFKDPSQQFFSHVGTSSWVLKSTLGSKCILLKDTTWHPSGIQTNDLPIRSLTLGHRPLQVCSYLLLQLIRNLLEKLLS